MNRRKKQQIIKRKRFVKTLFLLVGVLALFFGGYTAFSFVPAFFPAHEENFIISPNQIPTEKQDLKKMLTEKKIPFTTMYKASESSTLVVKLASGGYVYFDVSKDLKSQAGLLSSLLDRITIEEKNKKIQYIDMRYEKAIVKFE